MWPDSTEKFFNESMQVTVAHAIYGESGLVAVSFSLVDFSSKEVLEVSATVLLETEG